jgi:hypothetical protein
LKSRTREKGRNEQLTLEAEFFGLFFLEGGRSPRGLVISGAAKAAAVRMTDAREKLLNPGADLGPVRITTFSVGRLENKMPAITICGYSYWKRKANRINLRASFPSHKPLPLNCSSGVQRQVSLFVEVLCRGCRCQMRAGPQYDLWHDARQKIGWWWWPLFD